MFTLPAQFRPLARAHPRRVFDLLFLAASSALFVAVKRHLKGETGITAMLHTWTRSMLGHPHVHCIVPAGVWTSAGWVHRKGWLVPAAMLRALFRQSILAGLAEHRDELGLTDDRAWKALLRSLPKGKQWVVYMAAPMSDVVAVVKYLGQYTHRIAISDWRLRAFHDGEVTFVGTHDEHVTLSAEEFTDRFMQHVLPHGFRKIRHYGLYAPGGTVKRREEVRAALMREPAIERSVRNKNRCRAIEESWTDLFLRLTGIDAMSCPRCRGRLLRYAIARAPP